MAILARGHEGLASAEGHPYEIEEQETEAVDRPPRSLDSHHVATYKGEPCHRG